MRKAGKKDKNADVGKVRFYSKIEIYPEIDNQLEKKALILKNNPYQHVIVRAWQNTRLVAHSTGIDISFAAYYSEALTPNVRQLKEFEEKTTASNKCMLP